MSKPNKKASTMQTNFYNHTQSTICKYAIGIRAIFVLFFFLCMNHTVWSQTISGTTPVAQGSVHTYYLNYNGSVNNVSWVKPIGSVILSSSNTSIQLRFDSVRTDFLRITFMDGQNFKATGYQITVNPSVPSTPPLPTSIVKNCGSTRITRTNPPSGVTYYWQSSSSGTSTSNSATFIDRTSGSRYYLRAKNSVGWSPARTINYSVNTLPGIPIAPTVDSEGCGQVTLRKSLFDQNSGNGNVWYWQSSSAGTSTSNTSETITRSSGSVYYLRSRNTASGCWSTNSASVSYTIPFATIPPSPTVTNNCGQTILTRANPPSGHTYYWQSSATGTSTGLSSSTLTRTSGTIYYIRSRNNSTQCWSSARTIPYTGTSVPSVPPLPTTSNSCGQTILARANPPSGHTYYWQSSATATSTTNSSTTATRTSGTNYYIRSRSNSTQCWSPARTITYSVNTLPGIPITPTVDVPGCEVVTFKRTLYDQNSGNGNIWYWQSSATGTSTSNTAETITLSRSSVGNNFTYYLRSRNTASGCWSTNSASISYSFETIAVPPAPTVDSNCGNTTLTRANNPSGFSYYWQNTPTGVSTVSANTQQTKTFSTSGTTYLRSRSSSGCWSAARTISYTVDQGAAQPPLPTINNSACGSTVLTRANPPSNHTFYWQSSAGGTSTANSSTTVTRTSGTSYYIRSRNNTTLCWSPSRTITYSVKILPGVPINPTVDSEGCNEVTLRRTLYDQNSGNGNIWYWQSTASGTSRANTAETITLTSGSIHYLRSRNTASGCWSENSAAVSYSLTSAPIWYLDADNDGYAISTQESCTSPGVGYGTTVKPLGDCDDTDDTVNPETVWYADSDGDNFPNPNAETREQCDKPTGGNWTSNPNSFEDLCPNYFSEINKGCNEDCNDYAVVPARIDFSTAGGSQTATVEFANSACNSGYSIEILPIPDNADNWLSITLNGNELSIVCEPGSEAKDVSIPVRVNGNTQGGIRVTRDSPVDPPDPDPSCTIANIANISFGAFADTKTVTINSTGNCSGIIDLKHPYEEIPDWLQITKSGTTFTLAVQNNDSGTNYNTLLIPVLVDGNGTTVPIGQFFSVSQANCLTEWYLDSDNDGLGDVYSTSLISCIAPNDGRNWVDNNTDLCPLTPGSLADQGCPTGQVPENRNTVTARGYDINGSLKTAGKVYFNVLGKLEQSQSLDVETNRIWASEIFYDSNDRPAVQTLSAPTNRTDFLYKENFTLNSSGAPYNIDDFETNLENPSTVSTAQNTLGWYYSEQNTDAFYEGNDYQDITNRPYARTVYSTLMPDVPLKTVGGNKPDTNGDGTIDVNDVWPNGYTFSMLASQELSQEVAFGTVLYDTRETIKTVSRDVHGVENIVFVDTDDRVLAAARSGGTNVRAMQIAIGEQAYVDIHVPTGNNMGFTVSGGAGFTTYDLITENQVTASTSLPNGFYRVAIDNPDSYSAGSITVNYQENYYDYSLNEYDLKSRLVASYQPLNKLKTEYKYNKLDQLVYIKSPDEGEAWFKYREDGQIRFSQNSKQVALGEFSYTNYDTYGRPMESGVVVSNLFNSSNPDNATSPTGTKKEQQFTTYDSADNVAMAGVLGARANLYPAQSFVAGNVAHTSNDQSETWYAYDIYGRVKWLVQNINGLGVKTIDYEYDSITGLVTKVVYQKQQTDQFIHRYGYDVTDQLILVETSTNGSSYTTHATYEYYETGALKRTELAGGVQGLDYVYNLSGQLKGINHPSLNAADDPGQDNNDLFGMQVDYHSTDFTRNLPNMGHSNYGTDQLNGNIKGIRWNNTNPNTTEGEYVYSYDRNNWLTAADFDPSGSTIGTGNLPDSDSNSTTFTNGQTAVLEATNRYTLSPGFHAETGSTVTVRINTESGGGIMAGDYDVSNITYDANGNIQSLVRKKASQGGTNAMDNLSYTYKTDKPNQLLRVDDADGDVANADDIDDQNGKNYIYNSIGQLTDNVSEGVSYRYNTNGLVTEVQQNGQPVVKFFYNDRNHRIKKESYTNGILVSSTFYVRDVAGQTLAIYNDIGGITALAEQPVYGSGRIGVAYSGTNNAKQYVYELTDHLGNVRAVFTKNGAENSVGEGFTDYYPGGMAMPGRNVEGNYRYKYQGQEKDPETGMEAFELRLYDSRINRWLSPDPAREFDSPYIAMGNNPVYFIDKAGDTIRPANIGDQAKVNKYKTALKAQSPDLFNYLENHSADIFISFGALTGLNGVTMADIIVDDYKQKTLTRFSNLVTINGKKEPLPVFRFTIKDPNSRFAGISGQKSLSPIEAESLFNARVANNRINITIDESSSPDRLKTFAHELGHAEHILKNTFNAWMWSMIEASVPKHPKGAGHSLFNPSGTNADNRAKRIISPRHF